MKHILHIIKNTIFKGLILFFRIFPINNKKIVVDNFGGKGYGDNPKYIVDELLKRDKKISVYWLVNKNDESMPKEIHQIKFKSIVSLYHLATSKIWIDNIRKERIFLKRKNQFYLQTWHGSFGPKLVEKEAITTLNKEYIKNAKFDSKIMNAIIADGLLTEKQYQHSFWIDNKTEILRYGLPRNDFLIKNIDNHLLKDDIRGLFNINHDEYIILYAPTFRDDFSLEGYKLDFNNILKAFEKKLNKKCKMIVRLHPNVQNQNDFITYNSNIINGSLYSDMQELILISDCLISDYSSLFSDFLLIKKPALICALDYSKYKKTRGLLEIFDTFPFPKAYSNDELINNIMNFDINRYEKEINAFLNINPIYDDGHASDKTVNYILSKIN